MRPSKVGTKSRLSQIVPLQGLVADCTMGIVWKGHISGTCHGGF